MKKFWLVLLSLGLVMAFSVSAFAVDVKVSAEYYAAGLYLNKTDLRDTETNRTYDSPSTAFFFQRLRVGTDFVVSPGLKLVTRFDAMERIWGGMRSYPGNYDVFSAGTRAENENIAMDIMYIDYTSPIGLFRVGYMNDYVWGTTFGNNLYGNPTGQIEYIVPVGPFYLLVNYAKEKEWNANAVNYEDEVDQDYDSYRVAGIYKAKDIEAGLLFLFDRSAVNKDRNFTFNNLPTPSSWGFMTNAYALDPYVKAKIGPVNIQAEIMYFFGDAAKWEDSDAHYTPSNISISALSVFVDAVANFGMFNVGGTFAYLSGDDPNTNDKLEGSGAVATVNHGGFDWNPCLIMFNYETIDYWVGGVSGKSQSQLGGPMSNAWFVQGRAGVKPTPQLDVQLAVSYATADQKPIDLNNGRTYGGGTYGTEIDLTGTYKITNNLSYMLGAGYLFTGDYYKGDNRHNNTTVDDFLLINKLTLSF
jgi:hypothetical protein